MADLYQFLADLQAAMDMIFLDLNAGRRAEILMVEIQSVEFQRADALIDELLSPPERALADLRTAHM